MSDTTMIFDGIFIKKFPQPRLCPNCGNIFNMVFIFYFFTNQYLYSQLSFSMYDLIHSFDTPIFTSNP